MPKTFEELKAEFLAEQEAELEHAGVKGMKWGHRKAEKPSGGDNGGGQKKGFFNKPSVGKAVLLGSYGKKSSYTDPKALALRKSAGRLRIAAVLGAVGGTAITQIGRNNAGVAAVGQLISIGAGAVSVASIVQGAQGASREQIAREDS